MGQADGMLKKACDAMREAGNGWCAAQGWAGGRWRSAPASVLVEAVLRAVRDPTPAMVAAVAPLTARPPAPADYEIAAAAVELLPPNEHPDIADVLAQIVVDHRAMVDSILWE